MDLRTAIKGQYHGGLKMLRQAVEVCPDDLWLSGEHPRSFWRIAYHAVFYTHLYLMQNEASFEPWDLTRENCSDLWGEVPVEDPYSKQQILDYIDRVIAKVDPVVDALDLETDDPGFYWYKGFSKLEHELMSFRHLQGHVGQLSEYLMARNIDIDWVGRA